MSKAQAAAAPVTNGSNPHLPTAEAMAGNPVDTSFVIDEATARELRRLRAAVMERAAELGSLTHDIKTLQDRQAGAHDALQRAREDVGRAMEQAARMIGIDPSVGWTLQLDANPAVFQRT